jgi:hypothetical protein
LFCDFVVCFEFGFLWLTNECACFYDVNIVNSDGLAHMFQISHNETHVHNHTNIKRERGKKNICGLANGYRNNVQSRYGSITT